MAEVQVARSSQEGELQDLDLVQLEQYATYIGSSAVQRIMRKAALLRGCHVAFLSSTYYDGGVAELIGSATLLLSTLGIRVEWRVIQGTPDFFSSASNDDCDRQRRFRGGREAAALES